MKKRKSDDHDPLLPKQTLNPVRDFTTALTPHLHNLKALRKNRGEKKVIIEIGKRTEQRVRKAIERRSELMRMYTREMPRDYLEQLIEADRIIATAVSVAFRSGANEAL